MITKVKLVIFFGIASILAGTFLARDLSLVAFLSPLGIYLGAETILKAIKMVEKDAVGAAGMIFLGVSSFIVTILINIDVVAALFSIAPAAVILLELGLILFFLSFLMTLAKVLRF